MRGVFFFTDKFPNVAAGQIHDSLSFSNFSQDCETLFLATRLPDCELHSRLRAQSFEIVFHLPEVIASWAKVVDSPNLVSFVESFSLGVTSRLHSRYKTLVSDHL